MHIHCSHGLSQTIMETIPKSPPWLYGPSLPHHPHPQSHGGPKNGEGRPTEKCNQSLFTGVVAKWEALEKTLCFGKSWQHQFRYSNIGMFWNLLDSFGVSTDAEPMALILLPSRIAFHLKLFWEIFTDLIYTLSTSRIGVEQTPKKRVELRWTPRTCCLAMRELSQGTIHF